MHGDMSRWFTLYGTANASYEVGSQQVGIFMGNMGLALHVTPLLNISVEGGGGAGVYHTGGNRDARTVVKERIFVDTPSGMSYYVIFEQRRLWTHPSGYLVESSRGDAGLSWQRTLSDGLSTWRTSATVVLNLKPEETSWPVFRRVVLTAGYERRLSANLSLGLEYRALLGGAGQVTFGEDKGLHALKVTVDYRVKRSRNKE